MNNKLVIAISALGVIGAGVISNHLTASAFSWVTYLPEAYQKQAQLISFTCAEFEACDAESAKVVLNLGKKN